MDHIALQPADMLPQLRAALSDDPHWTRLMEQALGFHLAVLVEPYLTYILEGRKTIESRFSKNRVPPFERVRVGDLVFLKRAAGPVVGVMHVERTDFLLLNDETWPQVRALSGPLCADAGFWLARAEKHYATLLYVGAVRALRPFRVQKTDRRAWVILRDACQLELRPSCA